MMRQIAAVSLILIVACTDSAPTEDPIEHASRLQADGQADAALMVLRQGMRSAPEDPDIRLLLAEVYLDLGQNDLAGTALDQALDRGLIPERAALPRAKALFGDGRFLDVIEFKVPADVTVPDLVGIYYLKADARAALSLSDDGLDSEVTQDFIELFELVESNRGNPDLDSIVAELAEARNQRPEVERAWQHHICAEADIQITSWLPLERPSGRVLQVGPKRGLRTVAAASRAARDGDVIEIDSGKYEGDVALWPQNNLLVRGVGERPIITSNGKAIQDRDVWLFTGDNVVVENVEISGARSRYENGAGIRHTGLGLTLRHVYLHDNENGLLTGNRYPDTNAVLIEFSEFARNGDNRGYAHNIYVGRSKSFEMRYSYSHESRGGHLVKSRARQNNIAYNRLTDGSAGTSSYVIDIPEGGVAMIVGNELEQGPETLNHGMISYAGEESRHTENQLIIANNSIYNRDFEGVAVRNHKDLDVVLANNLFGGAPVATILGEGRLVANQTRPEHGMNNPRNHDYELTAGAAAIDSGTQFDPTPTFEYVHPVRARPRQQIWRIDVGAHERCGL